MRHIFVNCVINSQTIIIRKSQRFRNGMCMCAVADPEGGRRVAGPLSVQFLAFSCSFQQNFSQIINLALPAELALCVCVCVCVYELNEIDNKVLFPTLA